MVTVSVVVPVMDGVGVCVTVADVDAVGDGMRLGEAVTVVVSEPVALLVAVIVGVRLPVGELVTVGVGVSVEVCVCDGVAVGGSCATCVNVGASVGVAGTNCTGVLNRSISGVAVRNGDVGRSIGVLLAVGVLEGVAVEVAVFVGSGVMVDVVVGVAVATRTRLSVVGVASSLRSSKRLIPRNAIAPITMTANGISRTKIPVMRRCSSASNSSSPRWAWT